MSGRWHIGPIGLVGLIGVFVVAVAAPAFAQAPAAASSGNPTADADAPVPVPQPSEKALRYHHGNNYIWATYKIGEIVGPAILLFTGLSARIRAIARRLGRYWFFTIALCFVLVSILSFIVSLPLDFYVGYVRQHAYGLSNQSIAKWVSDAAIGLTVECVLGALFLWVPYLLIKRSPRRWWIYTGLLLAPFVFFQAFIWPIWVDPLFNKFDSMEDKALEAKILTLAGRAGIEDSRVYEVKKSVDTNSVNAYVTGFASTKRVVLWDTAITKLKEPELLFVLGHEMGHYVLGHVVKTILFINALAFVTLYLIYRTAGSLVARFKGLFGFDDLSDVASFPLILMLTNISALVLLPIIFAYSRFNEREADRFGLELTHSNHAAATAFIALQQENLAVPRHGWLFTLLRSSHPSIGDRIDFCNAYKPWETGAPRRYDHLFKPAKGQAS